MIRKNKDRKGIEKQKLQETASVRDQNAVLSSAVDDVADFAWTSVGVLSS